VGEFAILRPAEQEVVGGFEAVVLQGREGGEEGAGVGGGVGGLFGGPGVEAGVPEEAEPAGGGEGFVPGEGGAGGGFGGED